MQLELAPFGDPPRPGRPAESGAAPRVLAVCLPDLALQRVARGTEGAGPLAVVEGGRVLAANAAARASGVRRGLSAIQAEAACAGIALVPHDGGADRAALEALAEALLAIAPAVELSLPDAVLADASAAGLLAAQAPARGEPAGSAGGAGTAAETEAEAALAARAVALAGERGFRARAVVASGRGPARALARFGGSARPVPAARTAEGLAALPLHALELPEPVAARLRALGVADAGALAQLPAAGLGQRFGAAGVAAWRLARGEDATPLSPWWPVGLPAEELELEAPVESAEPLLFALKRLCDRAAARLAGRGLGAVRLALALRLDPGFGGAEAERVELALAAPSASPSRWLLVLRERLPALRLPGAVTAVRLEVAEAAPAPPEQLALADRPAELAALDAVLARIAARLGAGSAFAAEPVERYRPEAAVRSAPFRAKPGAVPPDPSGSAADGRSARDGRRRRAAAESKEEREEAAPRPTRLLAAPLPLVAEGAGGGVTAVRLDGRAFAVLSLSPPERLAGEWWDRPFDREYRRARLEGLGECWIFRDVATGRLWLHGFFD